MKKNAILLLTFLGFVSCTFKQPTVFSEKALSDTFISLDDSLLSFSSILEKHEGKKILINVWASWCGDCIKALPREKELQKEFSDVVFMHLSLDRNIEDWKLGIERLDIKGEHYFMQSGWKGDFGNFLNLNWIPRYVVIAKDGRITLFEATKPNDKTLLESLRN